ncbi:hypothetical protein I4U23_001846 [Adineta vaga]|nr:hypothetical protein I4U23_001846 [Adineta vaga]
MNLIHFCIVIIIVNECYTGPIEDLSAMPDLSLFYQQLIRQPDLQGLLQDVYQSQQPLITGDFTIFAPNNDAMSRLNRRNEDPNLLWKYHIVPGRYDDQALYNMAQDKINQANPRQMTDVRPQNNLLTLASPFQVFYGVGFYGGTGPYINVSFDNTGYGQNGMSWSGSSALNITNTFQNSVPLNPYLVNTNNYNPNQHTQSYVVAQGSASSGNPNLFPQNLTNYYTNVFNPNVNTQFLQNANPPTTNFNPNFQQQQQQFNGQVNYAGIGIPRPTINNAFVLQSRIMSRGIINVVDNILWPPERRDQTQFKTAYDALDDPQFSRLRLLADRSEYFQAELRSINHQTWFLPNDQAFSSFGTGLSFLFEAPSANNIHDINDFVKSHILPIVLYPSAMDASKQISTLSLGKWVTFRKSAQSDAAFQVDVVSNRQVAHIVTSRPEDIRIYGNGVVYPITTILSGPARSAADELARSYQYFMALIQQSGDTELVNLLQGNTAGLGNTGPNIFNPQNLLNVTVLIPQQISVQQLGNSQDLSRNLRRHILRFPVYTDQLLTMSNAYIPQQQQQQPYIQQGYQVPLYQRSGAVPNKKLPRRRRRRRQLNVPPNMNYQQQQQQMFPSQPLLPNDQQQQMFPSQPSLPNDQQQQILPNQQLPMMQQQPLNPTQNPNYYQIPTFPSSGIFQDGQIYPTMDPEFSIQAQISSGPNGNVVTLIGRPANSLPFTATILNTESNIPIKNGVMHVIRGILSGAVIPLDTVLSTMQGASSFSQLMQQTGVIDQLKQSGRSYTLFIPTNIALQTIGVTNDINRIRQFVLRHICSDVLLDPMANILSRSGSYISRSQMSKPPQQSQLFTAMKRNRRKRQDWADTWRNGTVTGGGQNFKAPDLGPGYFQPQQQVYGGYPAAPSPFSSYNQLYNPGYVMNGYANPNSQYYPGYNGTFAGMDYFNYQSLGVPNQGASDAVWNNTYGGFYNPQVNVVPIAGSGVGSQSYYTGAGGFYSGANNVPGPQSCTAMTGDRITIQPLPGPQTGGVNTVSSYQNFVVTCCGDQSVNGVIQSFNVYPPSYAVYIIGRSLLGYGQSVGNIYNHAFILYPSQLMLLILTISLIFIKHL